MANKAVTMSVEKPYKKEKNQNIQVVVRLRPTSKREGEIRSHTVVEVSNNREVVVKPTVGFSKKFTYDRAFGPSSTQVEVYHEVVSPLISEVLNGYSCTVFAYGQTGTGKTHTMVGENTGVDTSWQNDPLAGIIPRALSQIFDELRIINSEYTIRVSYLELYNEELFDLLSNSEDNSKLRIYEDSTKKGSNIVNGLEEVTVYSKSEVYKIMEKGQERRRIASTLMNAHSSRSHTIFTIVVHMKENSPEGEELMKIGKLNLVDLAGSENISKAGTDNPKKKERARECVNINQSLLTLGRVITALVERHPHVPYRESKLTRLLQESLGGRTKTSIIATIAPGHKDVEETLSTLEYAHRAKNIQNKPEVNQKLTKKAVLKEFSEEIDRLKRDLQASRDKSGVYLTTESYNEMLFRSDDQEKEIQNKILDIKALMDEKDRITAVFNDLSFKLKEKEAIIEITAQDLSSTKQALNSTKEVLSQTEILYREQSHLVDKHVETESTFSNQARNVLNTTEQLSSDVSHLLDSMDKRRTVEEDNLLLRKYFGDKSRAHRLQMKESLETFSDGFREDLHNIGKMVADQYVEYVKREISTKAVAESLVANLKQGMEELHEIQRLNKEKTSLCISEEQESFQRNIEKCAGDMEASMSRVLGSLTQLAELGIQDRQWLGNVKKIVVDRQNVHQENYSKLQENCSIFFSENQMQFDKLTEIYRADMNEQIEINKKFRHLNEVQRKEIANSKSTLAIVLNNVLKLKNEHESMELRNAEMYNGIEENAQLVQQREVNFDTLITAECCETRNRNTTFLMGVDETMNSNSRFMSELVRKFDGQSASLERGTSCREGIVNEMQSATVIQKESTSKCLAHVDSTISKILNNQTDATDSSEEKLQTFTQTCGGTIDQMITSADSLVTDMTNDEKLLHDTLCQNEETLNEFKEQLHESLIEWDNMESEYMGKQYKVYAPTGKTPIRKSYQYPKTFAATSPHERILKRFRSSQTTMLQVRSLKLPTKISVACLAPDSASHSRTLDPANVASNDPITIDLSESNLEASPPKEAKLTRFSSASSVSDVSCVFMEPTAKTTPPSGTVRKSTSESDIHKLTSSGRKVSKENFSRSHSATKSFRSKLRPPSSKKALTNHNKN